MIDSHQHFWQYQREKDSWISDDMTALKRDFLPENLKPHLIENGFEGCVAVQASQSVAETSFLLSLAEKADIIKGVVGWIDLVSPNLESDLKAYSSCRKLKGFRHVIQNEPPGFMLNPEFIKGVNTLGRYDYTFDLLIYSHQLTEALAFVSALDNVRLVIDHIAKPQIKAQKIKNWSSQLFMMSTFENVQCKISGMVTEADWQNWKQKDFVPYLDATFDAFGPDRLMYGSDWPVCLLSSTYKDQLGILQNYISDFSLTDQQKILGGNATKFYKL